MQIVLDFNHIIFAMASLSLFSVMIIFRECVWNCIQKSLTLGEVKFRLKKIIPTVQSGLACLITLYGAIYLIILLYSLSKMNNFNRTKISLFANVYLEILFISFSASFVISMLLNQLFSELSLMKDNNRRDVSFHTMDVKHESLLLLSPTKVILHANEASQQLFATDLFGKSFLNFIPKVDESTAVLNLLDNLVTNLNGNFEVHLNNTIQYRILNPLTHEEIWVESSFYNCNDSFSRLDTSNSPQIAVLTKDISKRKYDENLLKQQQEAKLMYINCVAHDLKTPLQSFSYAMDLLANTLLTIEQRDMLDQATVSIDLMRLTISQTMHIGKALGGCKVQPRVSSVSMAGVIKKVQIIMDGYGAKVPICFHLDQNVNCNILTDEEWLWQNLLNLLTNACKYTQKGQIDIYVQLDTKGQLKTEGSDTAVTDPIPMILFQVVDSGIGLSEKMLKEVFEPFNQAQVGQVTGSGLGLFGVRNRVERLGGKCGVFNNFQRGCTFWFTIPYVNNETHDDDEEDVEEDRLRRSEDSPNPTNKKTFFNLPNHLRNPISIHTNQNSPQAVYHHDPFDSESSSSRNMRVESLETIVDTKARLHWSEPSLITNYYQEGRGGMTSKDEFGSSYRRDPTDTLLTSTPRSSASGCNTFAGFTAFVIDDTAIVCKLLSRTLLNMGFSEVFCYENGAVGLEAMMNRHVDIVFTDVQMPVMTGPEMVSRFRKFESQEILMGQRLDKQIIVVISANATDIEDSDQSSLFDFVVAKPASKASIAKLVEALLLKKH